MVLEYNIKAKTLAMLFFALIVLSCHHIESKSEASECTQYQLTLPDYQVAINFINDYIDFSKDLNPEIGLIEWINQRHDLTGEFKIELNKILKEARVNEPKLGLGFDPILDAQDSPDRVELDKTECEYLIVKGINWTEFRLSLKIKSIDSTWLVDGAGTINIPKNKRIKR